MLLWLVANGRYAADYWSWREDRQTSPRRNELKNEKDFFSYNWVPAENLIRILVSHFSLFLLLSFSLSLPYLSILLISFPCLCLSLFLFIIPSLSLSLYTLLYLFLFHSILILASFFLWSLYPFSPFFIFFLFSFFLPLFLAIFLLLISFYIFSIFSSSLYPLSCSPFVSFHAYFSFSFPIHISPFFHFLSLSPFFHPYLSPLLWLLFSFYTYIFLYSYREISALFLVSHSPYIFIFLLPPLSLFLHIHISMSLYHPSISIYFTSVGRTFSICCCLFLFIFSLSLSFFFSWSPISISCSQLLDTGVALSLASHFTSWSLVILSRLIACTGRREGHCCFCSEWRSACPQPFKTLSLQCGVSSKMSNKYVHLRLWMFADKLLRGLKIRYSHPEVSTQRKLKLKSYAGLKTVLFNRSTNIFS